MVFRLDQTLGPLIVGLAWSAGRATATYAVGVAIAVLMAVLAALVLGGVANTRSN